MKYSKKEKLLIITWLSLVVLSIIWIFFSLIFDLNLIINNKIFLFPLFTAALSLTISVISICNLSNNNNTEENQEFNEKQASIKDFYLYQQLLDPPDMNN